MRNPHVSGIRRVETVSSKEGVANKDGYKGRSNGEANCRSNTSQLEEIHLEIVSCFPSRAKYELCFKADTTDHSTRLIDYHNSSLKKCNYLWDNYLEERNFLKNGISNL
jgi:hypothetical protein